LLKYSDFISQRGALDRKLRSYNVQVERSRYPTKSAILSGPSSQAVPSARIDEDGDAAIQWITEANYQNAEEGESIWTLKAQDQIGLDKALQQIEEAHRKAEQMTHVGYLMLQDRAFFPRIVGSKGANVTRLKQETGADITVSRENTTITIIGKPAIPFICP